MENYTYAVVKGFLCSTPENIYINSLSITKIKIKDKTGILNIVWYNQKYLKNYFKKNIEYIFTGKISYKFNTIQLESPEYEVYEPDLMLSNGKIVPKYTMGNRMSQKIIRSIIKFALDNLEDGFTEFLPCIILKKYKLCSIDYAIENIHFPKTYDAFILARKRLVFEEVFLMQLMLLNLKKIKKLVSSIKLIDLNIYDIYSKIPFILTDAQNKVINEILYDIKKGISLNRLVQGDVGSGKTIIAIVIAYLFVKNEYQVILMVPTEVLAKQHFLEFKNILLNFNISLLTGSTNKKEKELIYKDIKSGKTKIIIGTHALIQDKVEYNKVGLVITDEQHRFGVKQREALFNKGEVPHVLIMTATPIPRTLAITLYGDVDISTIDELPPLRKKIDTYSVNSSYRKRIYNFIEKEIDNGRQCYIICPMVEDSEVLEVESVIDYAEKLKQMVSCRVKFLHGKLKVSEKQDIMDRFINGEIDIIVSTTVIEVGINVPNANVIVIENAERFGLSQLHQLRGRVGRGEYQSYCILISDSKSKVSKKRLEAMISTIDGFALSELDLKLRGPGDFFGTNQHGLPAFKIANAYKDMNIVKEARIAIDYLTNNYSVKEDFPLLQEKINSLMGDYNKITL